VYIQNVIPKKYLTKVQENKDTKEPFWNPSVIEVSTRQPVLMTKARISELTMNNDNVKNREERHRLYQQ
jgi:hypothetical protein